MQNGSNKNTRLCAIYARVSKEDQNPQHQEKTLKTYANNQNYKVYKIYTDYYTGTKSTRPELMKMLKDAHDKKFKVVIVWKLDRLGRSVQHLIKIINWLRVWKIDFICTTQHIDTTTSAGKLVFHILAAMAEFEKDLISERTKLGLKHAKNVGKRGKDKKPRRKAGYNLRYQKKDTPFFGQYDLEG